ncbi:BQ2448_7919 [Microbotryum intermedium]|uniref:Mannosyltransferase n=1 Tax=Microbotryum intermedium TaxID=269621 RepID=A0A238FM95_9BASI|nr:BQ2448_7919 [Microbotryum intermedium]
MGTKLAQLLKDRRWQLLVVLRLLVALSSQSVVHPDEHFQNPEVAAAWVFDYTNTGQGTLKTWEWLDQDPLRSIVPVAASTGVAFQLLRLVLGSHPSGCALFLAQRFVMFLFTIIIDICLQSIAHSNTPALVFATSPIVFAFLVRPFSNSLEAILVALAACVAHLILTRPPSKLHYATYGVLTSLGVFTRISFLFFTLPPALAIAYQELLSPSSTLFRTATRGAPAVVALGVVSTGLVSIDTYFFRGTLHSDKWVLTPLNLLRYNVATTNLEAHGLHPRYLHVALNWPMLFGAGLWAATEAVFARKIGSVGTSKNVVKGKKKKKEAKVEPLPANKSTGFDGACFVVPTLLLSLQPHQEPRFLVPLIVPLCLLIAKVPFFSTGTSRAQRKRRIFWSLWCLHTVIFTMVFGYLHQGGLLPSVFRLNETLRSHAFDSAQSIEIIFWRTFMPPRHLLLPLKNTPLEVTIKDVAGAPLSELMTILRASNSSRTLLVTPAYAFDSLLSEKLDATRPLFASRSLGIHLDMDRLDNMVGVDWRRLGMGVWEVGPA